MNITDNLTDEIRCFVDTLKFADVFRVFVCPVRDPFVDAPTTGYTTNVKVEGSKVVIRNLLLTDYETDDVVFISKLEVPLNSCDGIILDSDAHFRTADKDVYIRPLKLSEVPFIGGAAK